MLHSRRRGGICCLAASALVFVQGCYYYAPARLPLGSGREVRIEGAAIELHEGSTIRTDGGSCAAGSVTGIVERSRGDTLTLQPLIDVKGVAPRGSCSRLSRVTLLAPAATTRVTTPKFSGAKTALSVIGVSVLAAVVVSAFVLGSDNSARTSPSLGPAR